MILVTGGSGFVGRHLVAALVGRDEAVRVLSRSASSTPAVRGLTVTIGDLTDAASLERAADGVRVIIHLAARLAPPNVTDTTLHSVNVRMTAAVALAARNAGAERFIHVSSGGVYGDGRTASPHRESDAPHPGNPYERSKLAAEEALVSTLDASGVAWTILRPAGIYGAGRVATASFFDEVRRRALWLHGSPNVVVHPTHVSDVVQACVRVLEAQRAAIAGRILNVAGERALPFHEFVAMTSAMLGVRSRQFVIPGWIGRPLARGVGLGMLTAGVRVPTGIDRAGRGWVNRALDTTLVREMLGFTPIKLQDGLRQTLEASGPFASAP